MADEQVNANGVQTPGAQEAPGKGTAVTPQPVTQAATTPPTQSGAQPQTDFQKWQSERDRERARLQGEADRARRDAQKARDETAQAQRDAQEARMAGADPEEKAKFYQQQLQQVTQAQAAQRTEAERESTFRTKAMSALSKAKIDPNDQRLTPYITGDTWEERMANLAEGIAEIQSAEMDRLHAEIKKAEKRGALAALDESGVTQTSDATARPSDPKERKAQEYREQLKKLRRSGNLAAVVTLQTKAEREGISL